MPAATMSDTAPPASSVESNDARSVVTASGRRTMRSVISHGDAERALGADEGAEQVGPGGSSSPCRRARRSSPSGRTNVSAEHVVDREAVLEAVRAAGVLGHVAADRADLLAGRVGRVVVAVRRDRAGDLEVRDARLDDDAAAVEVDLEDAAHPRERDHDAAGDGQRAAREAGAGAARDERHAVGVAGAHARPARPRPSAGRQTSAGIARWPVSPSHS